MNGHAHRTLIGVFKFGVIYAPSTTFPPSFSSLFLSSTFQAHNRQTRFVAGVGDVSVPVTRGMLAQAKRNLDRMDVVGTVSGVHAAACDIDVSFILLLRSRRRIFCLSQAAKCPLTDPNKSP